MAEHVLVVYAGASAAAGSNASWPQNWRSMGAWLPVCCARPRGRGDNKPGDTSDEAAAKQQLDEEEKVSHAQGPGVW